MPIKDAYVLAYTDKGLMWCRVRVLEQWDNRCKIEFYDGSGMATWPVGELFEQPDLSECKVVQDVK